MRSKWIDHKGKRLFDCDYTGLRTDVAALQAEADAVGVEGIVKVLAQAVSRISGRGLTLFSDEGAAKDWLVADQ